MEANRKPRARAAWLRQLHTLHWVSSAFCLLGMLFFSATGLTLNHAGDFKAHLSLQRQEGIIPPAILEQAPSGGENRDELPEPLRQAVERGFGMHLIAPHLESDEGWLEVIDSQPGSEIAIKIERRTGLARYERVDRGWIAYLNDLHKVRHTGRLWSIAVDLFALFALLFTITGFGLLLLHARHRRATWPLIAGGMVVPLLISVLFLHV